MPCAALRVRVRALNTTVRVSANSTCGRPDPRDSA